jgi:hypothetical protein
MNRRKNSVARRAAAWIALAAVVFAQLALSAFSCEAAAREPASAMAGASVAPCHRGDPAATPLCVKHCQGDGEAQAQAAFALAAFVPPFVASVPLAPCAREGLCGVQAGLLHATSPPLGIRHCRLII